jgi:murein L,D-transpeptidase YcbB/YkuD
VRVVAFTATGTLLVALSGCSSDPQESAVAVAQAKVTSAEKALADAEATATETDAVFCAASSTYITALDRYGDVLNQTAPTVGDVKDAGTDLTKPRTETVNAGEAAVAARDAVTTAEQDLADAQATLAAAEAAAAGEEPPEAQPSEEPSKAPSEPPATVARVQQAEADFATAQAGITDKTPVVQAAEQFNAAAVALEMAWLQLFADVGCLTDVQEEQAVDVVRQYTTALQKDLSEAGYFEGEVDGVYGPETVDAVQALQKASGLPQTGTMDKATDAALRAELEAAGGAAAQEAMASTAAVQQTLKLAGYWDGPVDGQWSDELTDALEEFQTDLGVKPTGTVDSATITAFNEALATAQATPSPTPTPEASTPAEPSDEPSPTDPASS